MNKEIINQVEYNQRHTFDNPIFYVRTQERNDNPLKTHKDVKDSLLSAFDIDNPNSALSQLKEKFELPNNIHTQLDFINYGNTQLVYLATLSNVDFQKQFAVLINQPCTPQEVIKKEFNNLQNLFNNDSRFIVKPHVYYTDSKHGLYATSYIEKARCVYCHRGNWGIFDPKPIYHFIPFTSEVSDKVSSSMIALLVHYYDHKKGEAISQTQINGNDFMLTQDWNPSDSNSVLEHLKLISARGTIKIPFDDYLSILCQEFLVGTHYTKDIVKKGEFKVNHKSEVPLTEKVIKQGIELGLKL